MKKILFGVAAIATVTISSCAVRAGIDISDNNKKGSSQPTSISKDAPAPAKADSSSVK